MILENNQECNKAAVGCILTYKSKYLLIKRAKDNLWNSIMVFVNDGADLKDAIVKSIKEKIGTEVNPDYFTETIHKYGDDIVKYYIFEYNFKDNPEEQIFLNLEIVKEAKLFDFEDAVNQKLYGDEEQCLRLHHDHKGYI